MRAGEEPRKHFDESEAADRSPAAVFDLAVGRFCVGSNHHLAARKFAVVERKEESGASIPFAGLIEPVRKRRMFQTGQTHKYARDVAQLAPPLEPAIDELADVSGKSKAQKIQIVEIALRVP